MLELTDPKLLGWYLSLPPEDRKLIQDGGGFHQFLQRHPALEMSRQHVYIKYNVGGNIHPQPIISSSLDKSRRPTFYGVVFCVTCGISCPSGAKKCRRCNTHEDLDLNFLPDHVRQNLCSYICYGDGNSKDGAKCQGTQAQPEEDQCLTKQLVNLQDSFQTAYNSSHVTEEPSHLERHKSKGPLLSQLMEEGPSWQKDSGSSRMSVYKHPSAQASFSLDMELERHRQGRKPKLVRQSSAIQGQSGYSYDETSQLHSKCPAIDQGTPPEYYSLDSIQMDCTECCDTSIIQSGEPEHDDSLLATKGSSELLSTGETPPGPAEGTEDGCYDYRFYQTDWNDSEDGCSAYMTSGEEASSRCEEQNENFHSIMEDDKSITCRSSERLEPYVSGIHPAPVTTSSKALEANCETLEGDPSPIKMTAVKQTTAEKSTSPLPRITTCDVLVGTEQSLALCTSAATQTEGPARTDKHVITEVHMADLDYLAEEFMKLKFAQEGRKERKEKMTSSGGTARKDCGAEGGCDCVQRAQQAELRLLALQYSMCRQHCWRHYYSSAEGDQLTLMQGGSNQYRSEGPPANIVSVLQKLDTDYNETRDKILAGVPLDQLTPLSVDSQKMTTETHYIPEQIIGDVLGTVPARSSQQPQRPNNRVGGGNGALHGPNGKGSQEGQQRKGPAPQPKVGSSKARKAVSLLPQQNAVACNDACNSSEVWYDAEENLDPLAAEMGEASSVMAKEKKDESASEPEKARSSFLRVTDLPSNVTEDDMLLWFEKYHASEVSISTFSNDLRVAIVTVSGPQSAEAAARELNGCSMQGHDLHVEHINRPSAGSQGQASSSTKRPGSSGDAPNPQTAKTNSSNPAVKLMPQQLLLSSLEKRKLVCISPTSKGTCVPQHYATMGSFDTLMAQLTQRHPEVGRQTIMDALLELRAKHHGILSGLPLRAIVEMTSELLTRPTSTTLSRGGHFRR